MANLVVCCDGTWNTADQRSAGVPCPTNVVRLCNALAAADAGGIAQKAYYHPGVGTDGSLVDRIKGGAFGVGLDKHIMSAYRWLCANFEAGDRIFLFGFSRGAFTARSLGGMLVTCGLLDLNGLDHDTAWDRVRSAYDDGYRKRGQPDWHWPPLGLAFRPDADPAQVSIHFVGVWDTVGALGVPDDMALLNLLDDPKDYEFHDTNISGHIKHARHGIALDEMRATFTPTLWTGVPPDQDVKQVWFPGVHSDVGGGYPETGLSDGALHWMMEEAKAVGLAFNPGMESQIKPDPRGVLHDSWTGAFKLLRSLPRSVPWLGRGQSSEIHGSVDDRRDSPPITHSPYRPSRTLAVGEQVSMPIFAANPWNDTGIYLEPDARYRFAAEGQWLDRDTKLGPEGEVNFEFRASEIVHLAMTLWGQVEQMFQKVSGNMEADFRGTKREQDLPWFVLVGAVANGGDPTSGGQVSPHEIFRIGKECEYPTDGTVVTKPGYLYCYANDAWHFYDNNHGSVTVTVERTA